MLRNVFLNLSLNKKLIIMMLFLSFTLLSTLVFLYIQSEKQLISQVASHTADLSKAIQVGVEEVTRTRDDIKLKKYLKTLKSKGINEISIIDNEHEVIASTNPKKIGEPMTPSKKELIIQAELGEPVSTEGKTYHVILPVTAGQTHFGYIYLTINSDDFAALLRQNMLKKLIAALVVFSIGIVITVLLSSFYTRPIYTLIGAAGKVAGGDFNQHLPENRGDEIGSLTKSFNMMVQKLKENKLLEERLREAEHLSAVGMLSRSMAHEIRNPLNFISLSIDYINDNIAQGGKDPEKLASLVASIKQEIFRLDKLVRDFLDYGRPLKLNKELVDVRLMLDEVLDLVRAKAESEGISILKKYEYTPFAMADAAFLKTCVYNLILNSFQAMPEGGTITVETHRQNGFLMLKISDTGHGMSEENLSKVFEPFFTTKQTGLGLGLATTKRIIEEHGGRISFWSAEGKGTQVELSIPARQDGGEAGITGNSGDGGGGNADGKEAA
ncbi:MAG: ATP-binding protein [Actinomycetota bacterium]|nr:ATP-binding protein [Actinomycetota bacterium]